jgi:hypothetical protein
MSNLNVNIVVPGGTANGTGVDTDALQAAKTILVSGLTGGVVHIEGSDDNTNWFPIVDFSQSDIKFVSAVCGFIRARSSGVSGTVNCDVSAEGTTVVDVQPAMPVGNGTGAPSSIAGMGSLKTIAVTGAFQGQVTLEASLDSTNYAEVASFGSPGKKSMSFVASDVRVKVAGLTSGTPILTIAGAPAQAVVPEAVNAADATGLGIVMAITVPMVAGAAGTADDVAIYTADAPFAFRVLDTVLFISTLINPSTVTLRDAAAGAGNALSDALVSTTTGTKRNTALTALGSVALGGSLVLRRSDRGVAGTAVIYIQRT